MHKEIEVLTLHLPEYQVDKEPDHDIIGKRVDDFIKEHFFGEAIVVRCLGSIEHPNKTADELIGIIKKTGTDRYDTSREGDRYENKEGRKIDFFAFDYTVKKDSEIFKIFTWPFYHYRSKFTGGKPVRIDLIILYYPEKLEQIFFTYEGREDEGPRSDGWVFKDPDNKPEAVRAIIKITG